MIACLLASVLVLQGGDQVERVLAIADPPDALRAAAGFSEPSARARAEVEIRYRAGDLFGARRAALAALASGEKDAALALRVAELCTTLRDSAGAHFGLKVLAQALTKTPPPGEQKRAWDELVVRREEELARLDANVAASAGAATRAKGCSLLFLAGAAGLAWFLLRAPAAPPASA